MAVWSIASSPTRTVVSTVQSKPPNCSLAGSWGLCPIWRGWPMHHTVTSLKQCSTSESRQTASSICPFISSKLNGPGIPATKPENCLNMDPFHIYRVPRSRWGNFFCSGARELQQVSFLRSQKQNKKSTTAFLGLYKKGGKKWLGDWLQWEEERKMAKLLNFPQLLY